MSSAASAASVNGSNVNGALNPPASSNSTGGSRAQLKMSTAGKGADGARKQAGSPVDAGHRKPPAQKAWTQGTNPITQRSSNVNNVNGVVSTPKPTQNSLPLTGETGSPMRHLNDRMMYLLANLSGRPGNITLKNGEKYTGVLSGTSLDPTEMRYVFKMVKKVQQAADAQVNGTATVSDDYVGVGDSYVMAFDIGDVADFHVSNVILDRSQSKRPNGASSGFRTDTDISGSLAMRERNLQKWEPSADTNVDLSLESSGQAGWDQFQENEKLFGVTSNYDENYYTTTINRNDPQYAQRAARAEKIAREIEASSAMNAHVREERGGQSNEDKDDDEEDKYSGVRRDFPPLGSGGANKYTPPARRPPTGLPTVAGAPVDPAIISSQLARQDSSTAKAAPAVESSVADKPSAPEPTKPESDPKPETSAPSNVEVSTEAAKAEIKTAAPVKAAADQAQKPSSALKPAAGGIPPRKSGRPDNATATVEHDLLDSFKQFSAAERLRLADRQRTVARESKAVKLNDLKKFAQNFKLNSPVPKDLVPILAKDEEKQKQILEKAKRTEQELKATPPKSTASVIDTKTARPTPAKADTTQPSPSATLDRQQNQRPRPVQNPHTSVSIRGGSGTAVSQPGRVGGLLSDRLTLNQQRHRQQGGVPYNNVPHPIPAPDMRIPSGPSSSVGTPTSSASRGFNARAADFKPNPAANTFQPGGNPSTNSSPRPESSSKPEPARKPITSFFKDRPVKEPLNIDEEFNPVRRMLREAQQDPKKEKEYAANGGVPHPYKTQPRWDAEGPNASKEYADLFERPTVPQPVPQHNIMSNGPMPHQHQLPLHLQGPQAGPHGNTPHHTPRHPPVQPHNGHNGPPHFDGQHMQFSHSQQSSVHPSPRPMPPFAYGAQPQGMPSFPNQMPMQQPYNMSPGVQHVAMQQQGRPQFMNPQGGMGGHMMTNQASNGPFMGGMPPNPQMPMYSPASQNVFPQFPGHMAGAPANSGYPSPRPVAPMMNHSGSQQGHQPQLIYVQGTQSHPMFAQMPHGSMTPMRGPYGQPPQQPHYGSPQQHHQFPQPHRGTPSGNYAQPMMQQHSMQPQAPPTGPATHGPDGGDDVK